MSAPIVFTAADVAELAAANDANLPYTVALRHGVRTYEAGGTRGPVVWDAGDPLWTEPARVNSAGAPQERLTAGALQNVTDFTVVTRRGVSVPVDDGDDFYRLEWTHDIAGLTSPFLLYRARHVIHSYPAQSKFIATSEAPQ